MSEPLKLINVSKKFGDFAAVSDLSFSAKRNRITGFLGPNGAGKTTTIRMIAGLSRPTSGRVLVDGSEVSLEDISINKILGYLPESPTFYNWMTGYEFLSFIADIFALQQKEQKIKKLLKLVNLVEAKDKRVGSYSNGMKQRLGIAQAIINDPKLLVMDEPVSALDPIGRREILSIIEKLKESMTIIFSTHILADVDRVCDDVVIINKGKLVTTSPLSDLKEKYSTQILEIEFDRDPKSLILDMEKRDFAKKIEKSGNSIKVWLSEDFDLGNNEPLKFLSDKDVGVLKYGLSLPEAEDLFVTLLEDK